MRSDKIKNFYEDFSSTLLRDRIRPNPRIRKIFGFIDEIFSEYFQKKGYLYILDVACGIGITSERLSLFNRTSVVGIDISENSIKIAKRTVKSVDFECADFLAYDFYDSKFGLITLFDCLEHFPKESHWEVFNKINSLSRQGTLVAITTPTGAFLDECRKVFPDKLQVVDESVYLEEILTYANRLGSELLKYEKYGIDYEDQYQYFLLRKNSESFELQLIPKNESFFRKAYNKLYATVAGWKYTQVVKMKGALK